MSDEVAKIIALAAKEGLAPLGLRRRGRSRLWIDDHGWWTINVEFQASGFAKGCYLNVGYQHLWVRRNHLVFEEPERPLGGSTFVRYEGDNDDFAVAIGPVVASAVEAVEGRRVNHGEGIESLQNVASSPDDLNAGIAAAILGQTDLARRRLTGSVHSAYRDQADAFLELSNQEASSLAHRSITETRQLLRLPEHWSDWRA